MIFDLVEMSSLRPLVGIAVIVVNPIHHPGCVLISERLSSHGKGSYQLPGGHLEYGESFEECAKRELAEETNLDCSSFKLIHVTNTIFSEEEGGPKQYVTLFLKGIIDDDSTLKCLEPQKNSDWIWTKWNDLKNLKLFAPLKQAVNNSNLNPFDDKTFYS
jgi:8-oxo-dGTP diphosphatase